MVRSFLLKAVIFRTDIVNKYPMTKNEPIYHVEDYHARNVNR